MLPFLELMFGKTIRKLFHQVKAVRLISGMLLAGSRGRCRRTLAESLSWLVAMSVL